MSSTVYSKLTLINMSGHPLSPEAEAEFRSRGIENILDIKVENVDFAAIDAAARSLVDTAREILGDKIFHGQVIYILPGLSPLALSVLAVLHGLLGHFPPITYLVRSGAQFVPGPLLDLQEVRDEARNQR